MYLDLKIDFAGSVWYQSYYIGVLNGDEYGGSVFDAYELKLNLLASKMSLHLLIMGKTFRKLCLFCKWFNLIFDYLTEGVPLIFPPPMRKLVINSFVWSMISRADALYVDSPVNCLPF